MLISLHGDSPRCRRKTALFPDDLYLVPLSAPAVDLAVEDLFPRPEIELSIRDRNYHLAPHDLSLVVGITVLLPRTVVMIALRTGVKGGQFLAPARVLLVH